MIDRASKTREEIFGAIRSFTAATIAEAEQATDAIIRIVNNAAPSPSPAPGVVEDDAETLKARVAAVLCEAGALCGWPAPNCNAREGAEALFKAGLLALASLSQPAKGEREGGGRDD